MEESPQTSGRKVVFVSHHAGIVGGGELSLLGLIKGLRRTDWTPVLVVPEGGPLAEAAAELGASIRESTMPTLRRPGPSVLASSRGIRRLMRSERPDIVHANGTRAMFYGGLGARAAGCPAIWHLRIWDRDPHFDPLLVRLADAVVANSRATRSRLAPWPHAERRCRVIPNGVDLDDFSATTGRRETRKSLGLPPDATVITAVGRLVDFKRFDLLVDAVAGLRPEHPDVACVIVGDGPEKASLRARVARAGLEDVVVFAGHRGDVANILAASDLFAHPSPREAFGRVVVEAMAMGLPVVAPAAGGPAEIVRDGETGFLIRTNDASAIADAISRLVNAPHLRTEFGGAGRQRVLHRYSLQRHTEDTVEFYQELLEQQRSRRSA